MVAASVSRTADAPPPARVTRRMGAGLGDRLFGLGLTGAAWIIVLLAGALVAALGWEAREAIATFGWRFLTTSVWDPVQGRFGALPFIYGTLVSALLALVIAVPLSLGAAIFLAELAPAWIRSPIAFLIEMLAAVPSVVYGLWGIFVLVPWLRDWVEPPLGATLGFLPLFQGPPYGIGMLAAGVILAIMVVPYITSVSREVLLAVPRSQREAALGIGATRWETTRIAVLRYGRSGLVGAILLGLGRALGET
ncbi:MAG TPA: phosphate ABC transporter permease subunit PstC, partial [Candidatus Bathyarchaeia archaeon]|nr:phosphate ABC transporter permease subunit PstC [Candidatus Bathyarchaeia archaeon]